MRACFCFVNRCVKKDYVTRGTYDWVYSDKGTRGSHRCVIRNNRVSSSHPEGIDAGTFTTFDDYDEPSSSPYVLSARYATNIDSLNLGGSDAEITLFEMPEVKAIWDDSGSGAHMSLAVWRGVGPADTYSLGDFADGQHPNRIFPTPGALLVAKGKFDYIFAPPYEFREVWKDRGSGSDQDVVFYQPICPAYFRALGHVAVASYRERPSSSMIRCVNMSYTIPGREWKLVWNDRGSGADDSISVYEAVPGLDGQGLGAMTSVDHYDTMRETPYVLNPKFINYLVGKPAASYRLTNVKYDLDAYTLGEQSMEELKVIDVENQGSTVQKVSRTEGYEYTEETSWNNHVGGEIGVTMTVSAGIPFFAKTEVRKKDMIKNMKKKTFIFTHFSSAEIYKKRQKLHK